MDETLLAIETLVAKHHLLSLATAGERLWCCSMFFAYDSANVAFIVASDPSSEHMQNVAKNAHVAGTVALETKSVGKIEGIQFSGEMSQTDDAKDKLLYFKSFPYALAMNPVLWRISLSEIKLTDNRLGFGTKLKWKRESS